MYTFTYIYVDTYTFFWKVNFLIFVYSKFCGELSLKNLHWFCTPWTSLWFQPSWFTLHKSNSNFIDFFDFFWVIVENKSRHKQQIYFSQWLNLLYIEILQNDHLVNQIHFKTLFTT